MFDERARLKHLGLAFALAMAAACGAPRNAGPIDFRSNGFEGFEDGQIELVSPTCTSGSSSSNMLFSIGADETGYLLKRTSDGKIFANGTTASGGECTIDSSLLTGASGKKIIVTGSTGDEKLIIDFLNGAFAQGNSASTLTGTVVNNAVVQVDMASGTSDHVKYRGTVYNDNFLFGTTGIYSYLAIAAGTVATATPLTGARAIHDVTMQNTELITVSAGPGYDQISGLGIAGTTTSLTNANELSGAIALTVYGGLDDDIIISGAASVNSAFNTLNGDDGNDRFVQQVHKATDIIVGGDGTGDSVDYSSRSNAVTVTLGGVPPVAATGSVTVVAKASLVAGDNFTLKDGTLTKVFEYRVAEDGPATGSITVLDPSAFVDGKTLTLDDGQNGVTSTVTFCFDATNGGTTSCSVGTTVAIATAGSISAAVTAIDTAIGNAISAGLSMTKSTASPTISLSNAHGKSGNVTITTTLAGTAATVVGMSGGEDITAGRTEIDITSANIVNAVEVADKTADVINASGMALLAAANTATITLTNTVPGASGNQTLTESVRSSGFSVVSMAGGLAAGTTSDDGESGEGDSIDATVENVLGGTGADLIDASLAPGLPHTLVGLAGSDTIIGADDMDTLYGGTGDDTLKGGDNEDTMYGGDGSNTLQGGPDNDTINGAGANCPALWNGAALSTSLCPSSGTVGSNTIDFSDRLVGTIVTCNLSSSSPQVCGVGLELDTWSNIRNIRGGAGNDYLTGDSNDNSIWGGLGNDTLLGGDGTDSLRGECGADIVDGQNGNDSITGGTGRDTLYGGAGFDIVDADDGMKDALISCDPSATDGLVMTDARDPAAVNCQPQ